MIDDLLHILLSKKLRIELLEQNSTSVIFTFDVWAKPGARTEKIYISSEGTLIIQTRSRPVDGEANAAIIEAVSDLTGVPKSAVEIIRGEKSRQKRIKLMVSFTANKKEDYFRKKFNEIESQAV